MVMYDAPFSELRKSEPGQRDTVVIGSWTLNGSWFRLSVTTNDIAELAASPAGRGRSMMI